jgi:hypothetical protein
MLTASRILGTEAGSTAPVFLAFLAIHVRGGITAVACGAIARKGSPRHIRAGRWYYRAITVVFITATIGYQHRRRHRPGDTGHIAGMGAAYVVMLTAFYVDNGPHLPLWDHLPALAFWLLPSAIGAPVIARAIIRARPPRPTREPHSAGRDGGGGSGNRQAR